MLLSVFEVTATGWRPTFRLVPPLNLEPTLNCPVNDAFDIPKFVFMSHFHWPCISDVTLRVTLRPVRAGQRKPFFRLAAAQGKPAALSSTVRQIQDITTWPLLVAWPAASALCPSVAFF